VSGTTITERVLALRERPSPRTLAAAVAIVVRQGRLAEVLYGAGSALLHRPGRVVAVGDAGPAFALGTRRAAEPEDAALADWLAGFPRVARWLDGVVLRLHSVAEVGRYTVAGEYGEGDPRLFLMDDAACRASTRYCGVGGVRHIHCIHPLSEDRFLVTTGDSLRVLDLWRIEAGALRFERRILRFFGGFTAAVAARGRTYLGSDYSGRPNYLWRLEDGRSFFLPRACFRMFIDRMEVVDDRFIVVVCKTLDTAGGGRRAAVFDAEAGTFVEPLG
jgi:hypothetical protein